MKLAISNQLAFSATTQLENEQLIATKTAEIFTRNLAAFNRAIPNLVAWLSDYQPTKHSLFITKNAELNILLKASGIVVYPEDIKQCIQQQVTTYLQNHLRYTHPANAGNSCLVVAGVGLGYHLLPLLESIKPKYVIIYEPEEDFLKLSLYSAPWFELLTFCELQQIQLFCQHGVASCDPIADLQELQQAFPDIAHVLFYRHLTNQHLDIALNTLDAKPIVPTEIIDLHPYFMPLQPPVENITVTSKQTAVFNQNMQFFQTNHPNVYKQLCSFSGKNTVSNKLLSEIYLNHYSSHALLDEAATILKDPLVYGLKLSKKLPDAAFPNFISQLKLYVDNHIAEHSQLNAQFREIFLLGVLDPKACESASKAAETLVVIEQNIERFYFAIYHVKWYELSQHTALTFLIAEQATLTNIEQSYTTQHLEFTDSYIFQPYFTVGHKALQQALQESIQSTNGKSNHFEANFRKMLRSHQNMAKFPLLQQIQGTADATPVVVVGNGPSLEKELTAIKHLRNDMLLISCGTALAALLKNNLVPDYHIELEKEADTLTRLEKSPAAQLSKIHLITTVEVHPAIPQLFKSSLLNVVSDNFICQQRYQHYSKIAPNLAYSYYTVTNFALDLLLSMQMTQLYLVGVDFGFLSIDEHHTKSSSYFNAQGASVYDYELKHGATFTVPGNLSSTCLSVSAFNAARLLMEDCLTKKNIEQRVYNIGDGAKISGCIALVELPKQLNNVAHIKTEHLHSHYLNMPNRSTNAMVHVLTPSLAFCITLISLWDKPHTEQIDTIEAIKNKLTQQRRVLRDLEAKSPESFQLFNGSCRYFQTVVNRYIKTDNAALLLNHFTALWLALLKHYQAEISRALSG